MVGGELEVHTQRQSLKNREKIIPSQAYFCCGLLCLRRCKTRQGRAAKFGKQMLVRHLEVGRILRRITHIKAAMELVLMPDENGLKKANRKLFPVGSGLDQFSDSSSDEE